MTRATKRIATQTKQNKGVKMTWNLDTYTAADKIRKKALLMLDLIQSEAYDKGYDEGYNIGYRMGRADRGMRVGLEEASDEAQDT